MNGKLVLLVFLMTFFVATTTIFAQNNTNSSPQIKALIAKKRAYNKVYGFGYRVQLYNGYETRARSIRSRFGVYFPTVYSRLKYDAPDWKVQVGKYKTRLEADKALLLFQEKFSGIIVVPMGK